VTLTIHRGELDRADVQELLALHVAAMRAHSPLEACHVLPAAGLAEPSITFYSARQEGRLLGVGALKVLGGGAGEIKSMRTAPDALRRGAAWAILQAIIAEARTRGYRRLQLETGRGNEFGAANAFYERAGFCDSEPFGDYSAGPFTRFLALLL